MLFCGYYDRFFGQCSIIKMEKNCDISLNSSTSSTSCTNTAQKCGAISSLEMCVVSQSLSEGSEESAAETDAWSRCWQCSPAVVTFDVWGTSCAGRESEGFLWKQGRGKRRRPDSFIKPSAWKIMPLDLEEARSNSNPVLQDCSLQYLETVLGVSLLQ